MILSKIFFDVCLARKNYEMQKQSLVNATGIRQRPVALPNSGEQVWPGLAGLFRICPNLAGSQPFLPDPIGF
jgi:hypothetical protein